MSIFGNIVSAIFGTAKTAAEAITGAAAQAKPKPMTREEVEAKIQKSPMTPAARNIIGSSRSSIS